MIVFNAVPLEKYSSLNTIPLLSLIGIKTRFSPCIKVIFNFSLQMPLKPNTQAQLTFNLRDSNIPPTIAKHDFCINNIRRWRLNIANYTSFSDFLSNISHSQKKKHLQTQDTFSKYGASLSLIEDDWSLYADEVYQLYLNIAKRHGVQLYDLTFFRAIAKLKEYKLICVWYQGNLISVLVIFDEEPIYHSMLCGFDYVHSNKCRAYSQIHYELIRLAIESKKYTTVDAGMTADKAKEIIGFHPVLSCMDVTARNYLIKSILRILSCFTTPSINSNGEFEFNFHFFR